MRQVLSFSLSFLLFLSGCGGTTRPVRATPSELRSLPPGEGISIGSVAIRAGAKGDNTTSLLSGLKGKQWNVIVANAKDLETVMGRMALAALESSEAGQLKVMEGEEKPFVMILPTGEHLFLSMSRSTFSGTMSAPLRVPFRVSPGKTTYIGRLVIEMPAKMDTFLGLPTGARYKVRVEDAQDETIDALRKEYGDLLANVERDLMGQAQAAKLPGGSIADPPLQQDVLPTVWTLDTVWDNACTQRKVVDTAVTVSGQRPGVDPWTERWTVERCGKRIDYVVEFAPSPTGGTDFQVKAGAEPGK
jgi:hypothetical protein